VGDHVFTRRDWRREGGDGSCGVDLKRLGGVWGKGLERRGVLGVGGEEGRGLRFTVELPGGAGAGAMGCRNGGR